MKLYYSNVINKLNDIAFDLYINSDITIKKNINGVYYVFVNAGCNNSDLICTCANIDELNNAIIDILEEV